MIDERFMHIALMLARRGLGTAAPNPSVGCVIVKNNQIISQGWTQPGGRPHAEAHALSKTKDTENATAYVTLEPCAHTGKTPPCCEALVKAGIKKVVIGCMDPDPRVNGKGMTYLKENNIEVISNVLEKESYEINRGFFLSVQENRPLVTLKLATSKDFKIAWPNHNPKWVTNKQSRLKGHLLRHTHDAILVGIGTVLADDPLLTCRLPGLKNPIRVVLDTDGKIPADSKLLSSLNEAPVWVFSKNQTPNVRSFETEIGDSGLDLHAVLNTLSKQGITRLLIEGGARVAASFLEAGLVDQIYHFQSDDIIGEKGIKALHNNSLEKILSHDFMRREVKKIENNHLNIYQKLK